jgi:glycerol kinase
MVGDQHAATFGQACFEKGMVKSTYGTGCFAVLNTGKEIVPSENGLLTTVAYHLGGTPNYALEGSIFVAGAGVQWLRDKLKIIKNAQETESLAQNAPHNPDLYFVPAFAGLGAPWWDSAAKGSIVGMTLDTDKASITKAMLDAVCLQTNDLLTAMAEDLKTPIEKVRIDGGMIKNDWLAQRLSCLTGVEISRPQITETTAFGAALMAGLQVGVYGAIDDIQNLWQEDKLFKPALGKIERTKRHKGWKAAIMATQLYAKESV